VSRAFEDAPLELDADALARRAKRRLERRIDGLVLRDGHIVSMTIDEVARIAAQTAFAADRALRRHAVAAAGERLFNISRDEGARAEGEARITMIDTKGYNVDRGTIVAWQPTGDRRDDVEFEVSETTTVPQGDDEVVVPIVAVEQGEAGNDPPSDDPLEVVQAIPEVASAEVETSPSGGRDDESQADYEDRLVEELRVLSEAGVTLEDYEVLARRTDGVERALALGDYDPDDPDETSPRHVTLVPLTDDGKPASDGVRDDLLADLDDKRTVNAVLHTTGPSYTPVAVEATVRRESGESTSAVEGRCEEAVQDLLSPAKWGGGDESPPRWQLRDTVRYLEVASVLAGVEGVDFVESLQLNGADDDVHLSGDAPLPAPFTDPGSDDPWSEASTVTVTVEAP